MTSPFADALCNQLAAIARVASNREADDITAVLRHLEFAAQVLKNELVRRAMKAGLCPPDPVGRELFRQLRFDPDDAS